MVGISTTATSFVLGIATGSHFPSGVGAVPYPVPGSVIQRSTLFVAVSITESRGFSVSQVNTQRPSDETETRCMCPRDWNHGEVFFVLRDRAPTQSRLHIRRVPLAPLWADRQHFEMTPVIGGSRGYHARVTMG